MTLPQIPVWEPAILVNDSMVLIIHSNKILDYCFKLRYRRMICFFSKSLLPVHLINYTCAARNTDNITEKFINKGKKYSCTNM
jgi:hypothetical protein